MRRIYTHVLGLVLLSLREGAGISSRRVTLYVCVSTLVFAIFANICFKRVLDADLLYCLTGVIGACMGTRTVERGFMAGGNKIVSKNIEHDNNRKEKASGEAS